ncbi:MAG: hypothetical protein ACOYL5_08300 [Phototrophicaceae bacterium]
MSVSIRRVLWASVGLLIVFFALRVTILDAFPPFIDESLHIKIGQEMLTNSPLHRSEEGRLLTNGWWLLFQAPQNATFFTARYAMLLLIVFGVSGAVAVAYHQAGGYAAILTGALFALSPYHLFFSGFALADPIYSAMLLVTLALCYRLRYRVRLWDAVLVGGMLFIAYGTKISALTYAVLPILALTLRPRGKPLRPYLVWAGVATLTFLAIFGLYSGVQIWRGYDPFFLLRLGSANDGGLWDLVQRVLLNLWATAELTITYWGWALGGVILAGVGWALVRRRWFLLLAFVPGATVWISSRFYTRYLFIHFSIALILAALLLADILPRLRGQRRGIDGVLLALYAALVTLPFWITFRSAPQDLPVPFADLREYAYSDASGFGLAELWATLEDQQAERVIGLFSNCQSLAFMVQEALIVECPRINPNGEDVPALAALLVESNTANTYVIVENTGYVPQDIPGTFITRYDRPGGITTLTLYQLPE